MLRATGCQGLDFVNKAPEVVHMNPSPLVFVGPPRSGKTTIGEAVAKRCRVPFFDLDRMVEETYRVSIEKLFLTNKEPYFRLLETQCLGTFVKRSKPSCYVLATGGGAVISAKNRSLLKECGRSIYLKISLETILQRSRGSKGDAPAVFFGKSDEDIKFLLNQRADYYNEADWMIDADQLPVRRVIQEVMRKWGWEKGITNEHEK